MAKVAKSSKSRGGARPGERRGGRKKGTRNKKTAALVEAIEASGETPLDYMLRVMRDPRTEHERRDRMAANVAPYVHAKLASITHSGGVTLTHEDALDALDRDPPSTEG